MERYRILSKLSFVLFFISCFTSYGTHKLSGTASMATSENTSIVLVEFFGTYDAANNITEIVWSIQSGSNAYKFGIERSTDNVSFTEVGEAKAGVNSGTVVTYALFDQFPTVGTNYYRLRHTNIDGSFFYVGNMSVSVVVEADKGAKGKGKVNAPNKITLYANPVYESDFTIAFSAAPGEDTELVISDVWGNRVATIPVTAGTMELRITSPDIKGNYLIEVMVNGELLTRRVNVK